jgi:hypothetical protein
MQSNEKPTKLGSISFALVIVVVLLTCIYFSLFAAVTEGGMLFGMEDSETAGYTIILGGGLLLMILTFLITFAGTIFGILALRKQDPKRGLAITGLALNFLCFAPYCIFFVLLAIGGISTADFSQYIPSFGP